MNDFAASLSAAMACATLHAQPIVDIGLFPNATADTLEVRLRPTSDFGDVFSALSFTIRWPEASTASLGARVNACPSGIPISQQPVVTSNGFRYRTYLGTGTSLLSDEGCPLTGGQETVVTRIPVLNNDGIDQFHIINDYFTDSTNSAYFVSLGGIFSTGIIYSNGVPDQGNGVLQGWRFLDEDGDCTFSPGDIGIPYRVMQLVPGPHPMITGTNGFYGVLAAAGDYDLDESLEPGMYAACPPSELVPVTIEDGIFGALNIGNTADDIVDIEVQVLADQPKTGYPYQVVLLAHNIGYSTSGPVSLSLTFDGQLDTVSSSPVPDVMSGNTLQWNIDPLQAFETAWVELYLAVPPNPALIGTTVDHIASVTTNPDADPTNNSASSPEIVVGSFDPNDKTARTSSNLSPDQFFIDLDDAITYRIRFQNTGNSPAWLVVVTDTLDESLDMMSFVQGPASHPFDVRFLPGRVVEWTFAGINLPDSVSDEAGSHGLVSYRIRPVLPLLPGTVISNTANIFFDFNPPVITAPCLLTAEFSTKVQEPERRQLSVFPNPVTSTLHVMLSSEDVLLRVLASDGRIVTTRSGLSGAAGINVQQLPSGAYSVEAVTTKGVVHRARFIKQ